MMNELLNFQIYNFMLVFLRIGSALAFMPGFTTSYINMRQRLSIAVTVSLALLPFLSSYFPPVPASGASFIRIISFEILIGVFLGIFMQFLYAALNLAGSFAAQAIGFANAQIFDPTFQNQSVVIETFLSLIALTIIFVTDLHHLMLSAVIDSYNLFPVNAPLPVDNFSEFLSKALNQGFIMGFKIGSPFIAFTIIFYTGMGLISRLMPQLNIFFLSLPLQIYLGLGLLLITTPMMILWFTKYFEDGLMRFIK